MTTQTEIIWTSSRAVIDETRCIGCTLCINACPVDAIVGATKQMHTVITDYCTGCKLCVPPCPVDCIAMLPTEPFSSADQHAQETAAQQRFAWRQQRLAFDQAEQLKQKDRPLPRSQEYKKAVIEAALKRARKKRAQFEKYH